MTDLGDLSIDELLELTSLGTADARRHRASTPPGVRQEVLRRLGRPDPDGTR
jgi:hypothetical protein